MRLAAAVSLVALLVSPAAVLAQAPAISYAAPSAALPGQATNITFHGSNLAGPTALWTSGDLSASLAEGIEKNGENAAQVTYRFDVPSATPVGVYGVRLATGKGASNLHLLLVDDLPSVADAGKNKSPETAQEIKLGTAVDGTCEPVSRDYYKFTATKGQRVSVEVFARRLGSALDPVIRLLTAAGGEIAFSDDEPGLTGDCRFALEIPADGEYLLEIRDVQYAGGGGHRYRLRLGDFPLVNVPYPLGVQRGAAAQLSFVGPDAASAAAREVKAPTDPAARLLPVGAQRPGGIGSGLAAAVVSDLSELTESEPNNSLEEPTSVTLPAGLNGRFEQPQDRDYFRFEAKKGQRFVFQGQTRRLGSPTDLFLRLYREDGSKLAEAEDAGTGEGAVNYTFPADGVYLLMAEDLLRRGGPQHAYRVEVTPYEPGFSLAVEVDRVNPPQGGVFVAKVTAARRDYNGPITLSIEGAGEGLTLKGNVIPEKKNETTINVTLPDTLAAGSLRDLSLVGTAKIGEGEYRAEASIEVALQKQKPTLAFVPAPLRTNLALGVGPVFPDFFKLSLEPAEGLELAAGGTLTFKAKAERLNKFGEAVTISLANLPEGVEAKAPAIAKGKPETQLTLTAKPDAKPGDYKLRLTASGTHQNQPQTVTLNDIPLKIAPPAKKDEPDKGGDSEPKSDDGDQDKPKK